MGLADEVLSGALGNAGWSIAGRWVERGERGIRPGRMTVRNPFLKCSPESYVVSGAKCVPPQRGFGHKKAQEAQMRKRIRCSNARDATAKGGDIRSGKKVELKWRVGGVIPTEVFHAGVKKTVTPALTR